MTTLIDSARVGWSAPDPMRSLLLGPLALLAGCGRDLSVPPPKAPPAVGIADFAPHGAWAGTRVTITGHDLGKTTSDTEVRFGQSSRVAPARVAADGTSLDVLVPDDASNGAVQVATTDGQ